MRCLSGVYVSLGRLSRTFWDNVLCGSWWPVPVVGINLEYVGISSSPQTPPPPGKPPTAAPAPVTALFQFCWDEAHTPQAPSGAMHMHGCVIALWTLPAPGEGEEGRKAAV